MRSIIFLILLVFNAVQLSAESYSVFEKEGRFGLKDPEGNVSIPAVYERLGWSDGTQQVINHSIGFQEGGLWGLISSKNKKLTEPKYYHLKPIDEELISASIRGKFSNQLFCGAMDAKGKTKVSFNYFELAPLKDHLVVSAYEGHRQPKGLITREDEIVVPLNFREVGLAGPHLKATGFDHKNHLFSFEGDLLLDNLDSVEAMNGGLLCYRNGLAGYASGDGMLVHGFKYKSIDFIGNIPIPMPFSFWEIHDVEGKVFEWACDSLRLQEGIWIAYLNGAQHIVLPEKGILDSREYELKAVRNKHLVVKHTKNKQWALLDENSMPIVSGYDSIQYNDEFLFGKEDGIWKLHNWFGTKISEFDYQQVVPGFENYVIAKKNDYWGVVDFQGAEYITFKYDSIYAGANGFYAIKYLDKWGIADKHGNWIADPEYAGITHFGELMIARKGYALSIFHDGRFRFKTAFETSHKEGGFLVIEDDFDNKGVISTTGILISPPEYKAINKMGDYFELEAPDHVVLTDFEGKRLITKAHKIEDIKGVSEGFILAKKNGKWGFFDTKARLRIANRYDDAIPFSDGMAAISLRGRWGFVDVYESLKIQPFYDQVSTFRQGLAIVGSNGRFGLIDKSGEEIVELIWPYIERLSTGNYLVKDEKDKFGLIASDGKFLLRPGFDGLSDEGFLVIVEHGGKKGVFDYAAYQKFGIKYSDVHVLGPYILLKH